MRLNRHRPHLGRPPDPSGAAAHLRGPLPKPPPARTPLLYTEIPWHVPFPSPSPTFSLLLAICTPQSLSSPRTTVLASH